jgi:alkanesulfonate monooxygenase SsuD/methylene tetrahydromethanopterin reductase-like flavin-dependent oxidoreductase (luciferase family)
MDIFTQAEILLRDAKYETWTWASSAGPVTCFENAALMGFVHVFDTADALLRTWHASQQVVIARHAASLRAAGAKAWNVYSVFLTPDQDARRAREIERIEEDFALTRKIARASIATTDDVEKALLPLLSLRSKPLLGVSNFETRLGTRLKDISPEAVAAFSNNEITPTEVARILEAAL